MGMNEETQFDLNVGYTCFKNEGWRCPGCGRCYNPDVSMCMYCGGIQYSPYKFTWDDSGTINYSKVSDNTTNIVDEDGRKKKQRTIKLTYE